ncbi:MAG TPA: organomercurial lyase [Gaiellaceae bacterium]|nr:organomercurial lyase [Gaiellaceae bacterium]
MDELDLRIRNHLYASFVRDGRAQTVSEAAAELDLPDRGVADAFRRLHDAHALVLQPDGDAIRMLNPFSAVETSYRVESGNRSWFANCAWDALGILGALHADGRVDAACPDCGEQLELEVRRGELIRGRELLVHFVVPARRWWDDIVFT